MPHPKLRLAAVLALSLLAISSLSAQNLVRISTPGQRFNAPPNHGHPQDVPGGRQFRGGAFETLTLTANLAMPSQRPAIYKLHRLVIHFSTSPQGPSLRAVEIRNGGNTDFHIDTLLRGNYTARDVLKPKEAANMWDFGTIPVKVASNTIVRLQIVFPGGFEGLSNPGDFVLKSVDADFEPAP